MLQYAREAVLGLQGAFISAALGASSLTVKQINTRLYKLRDGCSSDEMGTFRHQVFGNPLEKVTEEVLRQKWGAFKASITKEERVKTSPAPVTLACRVGEGVVHEIATACYTRCGIYWAAGSYSTCGLMPTCKRCTGHSARWAGVASASFD